jgi:SAM-dependent methyltransferase
MPLALGDKLRSGASITSGFSQNRKKIHFGPESVRARTDFGEKGGLRWRRGISGKDGEIYGGQETAIARYKRQGRRRRCDGDAICGQLISGAVSLTMLHHVPSPALQDRLLAEVRRVLKPGGVFAGSDSRWSLGFHLIHLWDTMVLVEPESFAARLEAAGFTDVSVKVAKRAFRFRARRP